MSTFEEIRKIGEGSEGTVHLLRRRKNGLGLEGISYYRNVEKVASSVNAEELAKAPRPNVAAGELFHSTTKLAALLTQPSPITKLIPIPQRPTTAAPLQAPISQKTTLLALLRK